MEIAVFAARVDFKPVKKAVPHLHLHDFWLDAHRVTVRAYAVEWRLGYQSPTRKASPIGAAPRLTLGRKQADNSTQDAGQQLFRSPREQMNERIIHYCPVKGLRRRS